MLFCRPVGDLLLTLGRIVSSGLPMLSIAPALGDWQEGGGQILSFSTSNLDTFKITGKQSLYRVCVKLLNLDMVSRYRELRLTGFFGSDVSSKGSWRWLYKLPVEKWTADLQWRVI